MKHTPFRESAVVLSGATDLAVGQGSSNVTGTSSVFLRGPSLARDDKTIMKHKPFRGPFVILSGAKDLIVGMKMLGRDRNVLRVFEGSLASLGMTAKEI
jgi:hypothetical protein